MPDRDSVSRRAFLGAIGAGGALTTLTHETARGNEGSRHTYRDARQPDIACQQVPWMLYFRREGRAFDLEAAVRGAAASGLHGFEPIITSVEQVAQVGRLLQTFGLGMRSLYVEGVLHEPQGAAQTARTVLAVADAARQFGTDIILVRPVSLPDGRTVPKSDEQLTMQAEQLDRLGAALCERGIKLAWPNHDIELLHSAREFHHMLVGTSPEHVGLCLDTHWAYRGAGNSQIALLDIVTLYSDRINVLHLRQSEGGTFTEAFGDGDIDYSDLWARIMPRNSPPPLLILDQAPEAGTPKTMSTVEAHRRGRQYVRETFRDPAGPR